ncbi:MAG: hypothetical protein CSA85_00710 [Alphaproteobacteria bacterium]|nr:MAG: hypothetical protein CSA85_00710 [Alphaproteobacteria bacterium]
MNALSTIEGSAFRGENYGASVPLVRSFLAVDRTVNTWGKLPRDVKDPWSGAHLIDAERYRKNMVQNFIDNVLVPPENCRWTGFKEIRYDLSPEVLEQIWDAYLREFPKSFIIFNTRCVEDVARSGWWRNWDRAEVDKLVNKLDEAFEKFQKANPTRSVVVDYDDYTADVMALKPIFDMIGEPFDEDGLKERFQARLTHGYSPSRDQALNAEPENQTPEKEEVEKEEVGKEEAAKEMSQG